MMTEPSSPMTSSRSCIAGRLNWEKDIIAYCRIGERSAHTWFVLHQILGQQNVKNTTFLDRIRLAGRRAGGRR